MARIKDSQPFAAANNQLTPFRSDQRIPVVQITWQTMMLFQYPDGTTVRIETNQPIMCSQPQLALVILGNTRDNVIRQPIPTREVFKTASGNIHSIQSSAMGTQPQAAIRPFINDFYIIIG